MKTIKVLLLTVITLSYLSPLSQPLLTSTLNPEIGDEYRTFSADTTGINPGESGEDIIWDMSGLDIGSENLSGIFVDIVTTQYPASFPASNLALNNQQDHYSYFETSGSNYRSWGYSNPNHVMIFTNPRTLMNYPFTYGSSINDAYEGGANIQGTSVKRTGNISTTADGYGLLVLPTGTFLNVLRVKSVENFSDEYLGQSFLYTTNIVKYLWYVENEKIPLLTISSTTSYINGILESSEKEILISANELGIRDQQYEVIDITMSPNPTSDIGTINFSLTRSEQVEMFLVNQNGLRVMDIFNRRFAPGNHSQHIFLSDIDPGVYIICLNTSGLISREKIIKY